jgi:hypothetical protein
LAIAHAEESSRVMGTTYALLCRSTGHVLSKAPSRIALAQDGCSSSKLLDKCAFYRYYIFSGYICYRYSASKQEVVDVLTAALGEDGYVTG